MNSRAFARLFFFWAWCALTVVLFSVGTFYPESR